VNPALVIGSAGPLPAVVIHKVTEVELDEMWSFVGGKKHPQWLWEALDHQTGKIVGCVATFPLMRISLCFFPDREGEEWRHEEFQGEPI
jgi:IS1 transposase